MRLALALVLLIPPAAARAADSSPPCDHPVRSWWVATDPAKDLRNLIEKNPITILTGRTVPVTVLKVANLRPDAALSDGRHVCRADITTDKGRATYTYWYESMGFGQTAINGVARWLDFDPNR
ncbi:MAG: hypothetical protein JO264_02445 [Acidisphaera sp.]|nr:hypothetical protein [Acidisphaera sp.]